MKDLKRLDTTKLLNSLLIYIALAAFIFSVLITLSVSFARIVNQEQMQNEYNRQIDSGMQHVINHFVKDYRYRVRRLVKTAGLSELIKDKDREGLLTLLNPKFELMKEESSHFEVMQVHLADGTSLLRVHRPEAFGDDIASKRLMLQEIHKKHETVVGYETGAYANVYRVVSPIFDENGVYLGAFEIGINLNFIIEAIRDINGFCGVVFIKDDELLIHAKPGNIAMVGYSLQTKINDKLKNICVVFNEPKNILNNDKMEVNDSMYLTHVIIMKNFRGEDSVKLIFFQDVTRVNPFLNTTQYIIYIGIFLVLGIFIKLIYNRIKFYQENVTLVYEKQILQLEENEKEISNSQKYHKALFETMPNILIATNCEKIEDANSVMLEFFGYTALEEFSAKYHCICDHFLEEEGFLFAEMEGLTWLEYMKLHVNEIHKVSMARDGEVHHFLVYLQEIVYDKQTRNLVSFVDITELEKLNERVEIAINGTRDGLWDWNLVTKEIYFSPRWKEMLGYEDTELSNEFETWKSRVHPDDLQKTIDSILATHKKPNIVYEGIHRLKHKDGHWVWILDRGQTIFDSEGTAIRMVGFHTDITEIKELEIRLLSTKLEFDMFMRFIPANILIKDVNGVIIYANESASEFFNKKSIVGKTAYDLLTLEEAQKIDKFDQNTIEYGQYEEVKKIEYVKDETVFLRTLGFKIEIDEQIQIGLVMIDITQSYLDKQELQDKDEIMIAQSRHAAMGEMISMIAHQWRQPISVIAMNANNILADIELDLLDADDLNITSKDIIHQTQELSKTIDDFRDFFKPDRNVENILLKDTIEDALNVIGKSLENNNIEIILDIDKSIKLQTYERELMQVLINILNNAKDILIEKSVQNAKIIIKTRYLEDKIKIDILDNGGGVIMENIDKIFNPYFTTKSEKNGTGLGLYMSRTIVNKHLNGSLSVKNIDGGACFSIVLPLSIKEGDELL